MVCRCGIEHNRSLAFTLQPIIEAYGRDRPELAILPKGMYCLQLLFLDPTSKKAGERIMELSEVKVVCVSRHFPAAVFAGSSGNGNSDWTSFIRRGINW